MFLLHTEYWSTMFNYTKDGITVASILDTRVANKENLFPVKIRVTYKRERKYYSTGKVLSKEDWERLPGTKVRLLRDIRESIENSFSLVKMNVEALAEKGGFSFDALNVRLSRATGDTLNSAFRAKIEILKKEERITTMNLELNVLKTIEIFAGNRISFESVSVDWLKRYEKFLLKDKTYTTVGYHMREIRTIMNAGKKAGIIKDSQYPFGKGKYEIKAVEGEKRALALPQIKALIGFEDGRETTEKYRDLWFFIYLCNGINVADLVKLKYKNIKDGEICFIRQKTERTTRTRKEIRVTVTSEMESIIKKWGNKNSPDNYIFPYLDGTEDAVERDKKTKGLIKCINKKMNYIGKQLGFGKVTTYTARHSFATVLKRSGANISYISESLGHSDLKTTEAYLASFEKEERQKNAGLLTNFGE